MINENILSKIQKLFVLAGAGSANESDVALNKALILMQSYGLTHVDVDIYYSHIPASKRNELWLSELHSLCAQFSGVVPLLSCKKLSFAGDEIGVNVASELFFYLRGEIERQAKKQCIKGRRLKNDFRIGCVIGIYKNMEKLGGWRDMQLKKKNFESKYFSDVKCLPLKTRPVSGLCLDSGIAAGN